MTFVEANKNKAWPKERDLLTTGSVGMTVELEFSSDWDNLEKFCIFRAYDISEAVALTGDTVEIPARVLTKADVNLLLGIYGINTAGTVVIPTVWADLGVVRKGANLSGADNYEQPPETLYAQLAALVISAQAAAVAATTGTYAGQASFSINATTGHLILTVTQDGVTTTSDLGKVVGDSVSADDLAAAIASATATATAAATNAAASASTATTKATAAETSASAAAASAAAAASVADTKQAQFITHQVTLAASQTSWANVPVDDVTTNAAVIVTPAPASFEAWVTAGVRCVSQGTGTLSFEASAGPTEAVTANILILPEATS